MRKLMLVLMLMLVGCGADEPAKDSPPKKPPTDQTTNAEVLVPVTLSYFYAPLGAQGASSCGIEKTVSSKTLTTLYTDYADCHISGPEITGEIYIDCLNGCAVKLPNPLADPVTTCDAVKYGRGDRCEWSAPYAR